MDSVEDIEWYDGHHAETHPRRIKVNGVWHDVRAYERVMKEDVATRERSAQYRCIIGDNHVITIQGD